MAEINPQGDLNLIGFGILDSLELSMVENVVERYINRLKEKTDYKSLKLKLKKHQKGKSFLHEITVCAKIGKKEVRTKVTDWDLYQCLNKSLAKIVTGSTHIKRISKDIGENLVREKKKQEKKLK